MSMRTDIAYGYGICLDSIEIPTKENLLLFLEKHINDLKYISAMMNEIENDEDYEGWFSDETICYDEGAWSMISDIISKNTNVAFNYEHGNVYGESALMIPASMPWENNKKEKNLKECEVAKIIDYYFKQLRINYDDNDIGYISVEYYG